jgi:ribosomal protein L34E
MIFNLPNYLCKKTSLIRILLEFLSASQCKFFCNLLLILNLIKGNILYISSYIYKFFSISLIMVCGKYKSRKLNRVKVKTPKNGVKIHYRKRNRNLPKCAVTKEPLRGIPRLTNRKFKNLNLSKKRVSRPFGGFMSHIALKEKLLNDIVLK